MVETSFFIDLCCDMKGRCRISSPSHSINRKSLGDPRFLQHLLVLDKPYFAHYLNVLNLVC